jgi:hypothetical protein
MSALSRQIPCSMFLPCEADRLVNFDTSLYPTVLSIKAFILYFLKFRKLHNDKR